MMDGGTEVNSSLTWILLPIIGIFTILLLNHFKPTAKVNIRDKYVLITGCDSGFGRATAIQLDKMGVCVLATCLTKEGEQSLKSATSDKLKTFQLDVTNSEQIKRVFDKVKKLVEDESVGLWGLVNNAGVCQLLPIEWTPLSRFKSIADVNLWGLIDMTKTFLPLVKKTKGRVVNFSSVDGRVSIYGLSAYCVTKYGVEAFSDALRREMYPWGVQVSILEPGPSKTNINESSKVVGDLKDSWENLDDQLKEEYGEEYLKTVVKIITEYTPPDRQYLVVDAVVDALTSQVPRDRYVVGLDSRLILALVAWLPSFATDFILRSLYKVPTPKGCQAK